MLFHIIEGAKIVLVNKGRYYQSDVFMRDGKIYAKLGGALIGLRSNGTTIPHVRWDYIEGVEYYYDDLGIMRDERVRIPVSRAA